MRSRRSPRPRIVSATVGTLPAALLGSACLARFLPLPEDGRFAIGYAAVIPMWVALMCVTFLARRSAHAWGVLGGVSVALAAVLYLLPR